MTPIVHVVGARPNFMKAAPVLKALEDRGVPQALVHTGQHYDPALSEVFFQELGLPHPDHYLGVGSGSHAGQTAAIMTGLEERLHKLSPKLVMVYGDVNSTLAAAVTASKMLIPVAHVEAGLRSFDRTMPEEINRVVADALSDLLFVTTPEAMAHLANEGRPAASMHFVGNPMIDTLLAFKGRLDPVGVRQRLDVPERYGLVTLHRPSNVDERHVAMQIAAAIGEVGKLIPLIVPLHPRGRSDLEAVGFGSTDGVKVLDPLSYLDFMALLSMATIVITDSGGVQEETTILGVPCLTLRPNTERPITITHGTNRLVWPETMLDHAKRILSTEGPLPVDRPPLWDGGAGERIAAVVEAWLANLPVH